MTTRIADPTPRGLLHAAIAHPVAVMVAVILVVLAGLASLIDLPIQLTPEVSTPEISVTTAWPGASPAEVETELLEEQEEALEGVIGLLRMESEAKPGQARIRLIFEVGTELEVARLRVANAMSEVDVHPAGARQPVIATAGTVGQPISIVIIHGREGQAVAGHRHWVERNVLPRFRRIPGVAAVELTGGGDQVVYIDFDLAALAARDLSIATVAARVKAVLVDASAGDVTLGKRRLLVRTPLAPERVEDFAALVIGGAPSAELRPIVLGDVATVRAGLREPTGVAMAGTSPAMGLVMFAEAGANVLAVSREIRALVDGLARERVAAEGLHIEVFDDQVDYIERALDLVTENLLMGGALAIVVLWLFLRSAGAAGLIGLSIPICVCGTALGMASFGRSVNVVSLAGTTFAVGMVVDNSIVVLESIEVWRGRCDSMVEAARRGVEEVWGALVMNTATTAVVFVPVVLWRGEVGELLRDIAVAISASVAVSLLVSNLVLPSLAAWWLRARPERDRTPGPAASPGVRSLLTGQIRWLTQTATRSVGLLVLFMAAAVAVVVRLPAMEYLPSGDRNLVFGIVVPPPGYSVAELEAMGASVQAEVVAHEGVDLGGVPAIRRSFFVGDANEVLCGASTVDDTRAGELADFYRRALAEVPDANSFATQASLFASRLGDGRAVEIDLRGPDLDVLRASSEALLAALSERVPAAQARAIPSLDPGAPELWVAPRPERCASMGVGMAELALAVDAIVDGAVIGEWGPTGEAKLEVVLRARSSGEPLVGGEASSNMRVEQLGAAPLAGPRGEPVSLSALADITVELGPTQIRRIEGARAITLQVTPPPELPLERAMQQIQGTVSELSADGRIPASVDVAIAGTAGKLAQAKGQLTHVLGVALLISYLLLAALFGNFFAPVAVLVTIPLAGAGGVAGLLVLDRFGGGQGLDVMTAIGFLILIGVVVNNAILIVEGALARLAAGLDLVTATTEAVGARTRPILMTSLTSLVALLPMVLVPGAGAELYRGVGAIVLGGLAVSTALCLHVVPCVFVTLWRVRGWFERSM
ncbi:efflux RND transporter permease subunit [Nannocystis sp. SCPEA4]|uniref:efflux RND transporter permease subunit n=1 Tax=Nannocystis sp. SCPEA4 TaxID=2996787 RepID=UPI002270A7CC|nr:efflux RND transporter permease subunit [Nannocystis sp. SCPEA4]